MTSLLSANDLRYLRRELDGFLDRTCTLRTLTPGSSDSAGGTGTDTASDATVACRIGPLIGRERIIVDRLGIEADAEIVLSHETAVTETQRIIDAATGRSYEVVAVNTDQSYRTVTRVFAKRIG